MPFDLRSAVVRSISELKKTVSQKTSELESLKKELKRHEAVRNALFRANGRRPSVARKKTRRRATNWDTVLQRLPATFTNEDLRKSAATRGKSQVYLHQVVSRWAKQRRTKRVGRGKYQKT